MVLVIVGALPCLLVTDWRCSWRTVAAFAVGAMAVAAPIMLLWGGLVPPYSVVPLGASTFSLYNMMLSFAYAAVVMVILAPAWFARARRLELGVFAVIFAASALFGLVEISVAHSVVAKLPASLAGIIPSFAGSLMIALAVLFIICSAKNLYACGCDRIWLFLTVSMLLLIAAPGKVVHQYSSRYTAMASGIMVLASVSFTVPNQWRILRIALGMLIGLACLLSYYYPAN
jgi:hypothetical protein